MVYWVTADPPACRPLLARLLARPPWVNRRVVSLCHCSHTHWLTDSPGPLPLPGPCGFRKESFLPALFCEIWTRVRATVSGPDALGLMAPALLLLRDLLPDARPRLSFASPAHGHPSVGRTEGPLPPGTSCLASAFNLLCSPPYYGSAMTTSPSSARLPCGFYFFL